MTRSQRLLHLIEDDSAHMMKDSKIFRVSTHNEFEDIPDQNQLGDDDGAKTREEKLYLGNEGKL